MVHIENRPAPSRKRTQSMRWLDFLGYTILLIHLLFLIVFWKSIPNNIPVHFDLTGTVDRWGSKSMLIILPVLNILLIAILQLVEIFPEWHNYPKRFNKENAPQFYKASRLLINRTKHAITAVFALITCQVIFITTGKTETLGLLFLLSAMTLILLPIILYLIRIRKIS